MRNPNRKSALIFSIAILIFSLLFAGCGKSKITKLKPGDPVSIKKEFAIYFGTIPSPLPPAIAAILQEYSEERKIDFLLSSGMAEYYEAPSELTDILLENAEWIAPQGITIESQSIQLSPRTIIWKNKMGNSEQTVTVKGQLLTIACDISAQSGANPKTGNIIVKLPGFNQLGSSDIYVMSVDTGFMNKDITSDRITFQSDRPHYNPTPDTYLMLEYEIK